MSDRRPLFRWIGYALLALPAAIVCLQYAHGVQEAADLLHPTGEMSVRLMFIAMMIGPARRIWPRLGWLTWLSRRRRPIGVAAFGYAVLHLLFYLIDTGTLEFLLAEIGAPGIWTGWAAFALMLMPAIVSNDAAMRSLGRHWKSVQRLLYPAIPLVVIHWALLMYDWLPALIHVAPLVILYSASLIKIAFRHSRRIST